LDQRRARVAHEIFVQRGTKGVPPGALPIALIALNQGTVQWVDPFLVRRELGSEQRDVLGLGLLPQALREAQLQQYDQHLQDVLVRRNNDGRFAAAQYFSSLPAGGRLPAAALDLSRFTQIYFPQEMLVDIAIIPDDELWVLVDESLHLPPIDLTLGGG